MLQFSKVSPTAKDFPKIEKKIPVLYRRYPPMKRGQQFSKQLSAGGTLCLNLQEKIITSWPWGGNRVNLSQRDLKHYDLHGMESEEQGGYCVSCMRNKVQEARGVVKLIRQECRGTWRQHGKNLSELHFYWNKGNGERCEKTDLKPFDLNTNNNLIYFDLFMVKD